MSAVLGPAAARWRAELEAWALPPEVLDAAPEDPYGFCVQLLRVPAVDPLTMPTGRRVGEALGISGTLLDVGCGAGRWSGAFTRAHRVVGVEPRPHLAAAAREAGVEVVEDRWPAAAERVDDADVVSATHVLYDVQDATPFLAAMAARARRRVVIELPDRHPWAYAIGPLYRRFWDLERPTGPTADDAAALVEEVLGSPPRQERWMQPGSLYPDVATLVALRRVQLCLTSHHDAEIEALTREEVVVHPDGSAQLPPVPLCCLWVDVRS